MRDAIPALARLNEGKASGTGTCIESQLEWRYYRGRHVGQNPYREWVI